MKEVRRCVVCNKEFLATRYNMVFCSEECRKKRRHQMDGEAKKKYVAVQKIRKRKSTVKSLNDFANEATQQGITYGKKQAEEYAEQVIVGHAPKGYTRIGDRRKD